MMESVRGTESDGIPAATGPTEAQKGRDILSRRHVRLGARPDVGSVTGGCLCPFFVQYIALSVC